MNPYPTITIILSIVITSILIASSGCIQPSTSVTINIDPGTSNGMGNGIGNGMDTNTSVIVNTDPGTSATINLDIPVLRPYIVDRSHELLHAQDPSSYITPKSSWVRYYASQLYVDEDGAIKYKNKSFWNNKFENNYVSDWVQFGNGARGSIPDNDYWATPDYYLAHGMKGDCDEWMTTVTSLMLSGEMSLKENNEFVKQVIPAKAVMGYAAGDPDGWTEYQAYGRTWITTTASMERPITGTEYSVTAFIDKNKYGSSFKGMYEFTDKSFQVAT